MADDVASGVYWYLTSLPDVLDVIGSFPADDPDNAGVPWVFVRNVAQRMEDISVVKGSRAVALVCCYAGQAASGSDSSTAIVQRLEVDIWVDPLRDQYGNVTSPSEAEGRGNAVYGVLDSHLHRVSVDDNSQQWGDLITTGSSRLTAPVWAQVPDGDGLIRGACYYAVQCFGNYDPTVDVAASDSGSGTGGGVA